MAGEPGVSVQRMLLKFEDPVVQRPKPNPSDARKSVNQIAKQFQSPNGFSNVNFTPSKPYATTGRIRTKKEVEKEKPLNIELDPNLVSKLESRTRNSSLPEVARQGNFNSPGNVFSKQPREEKSISSRIKAPTQNGSDAQPPAKPPRTFAHDIYLQTKVPQARVNRRPIKPGGKPPRPQSLVDQLSALRADLKPSKIGNQASDISSGRDEGVAPTARNRVPSLVRSQTLPEFVVKKMGKKSTAVSRPRTPPPAPPSKPPPPPSVTTTSPGALSIAMLTSNLLRVTDSATKANLARSNEQSSSQKQTCYHEEGLHYASTDIIPRTTHPAKSPTKPIRHGRPNTKRTTTTVPGLSKTTSFDGGLPGLGPNQLSAQVRLMVSQSFREAKENRRAAFISKRSKSKSDNGCKAEDHCEQTSADPDDDPEIRPVDVEDRIIYIRNVSRCNSSVRRNSTIYYNPVLTKLFDQFLIVCLKYKEGTNAAGYEPTVKLLYPPPPHARGGGGIARGVVTGAHNPEHVAQFCFPDAETWKPANESYTYMFVLTNNKGDRSFGYCRRIKPEGSAVCLPLVYCVVSPILDFGFYGKILEELEQRHGVTEIHRKALLKTLCQSGLPRPGQNLVVNARTDDNEEDDCFIVQRPLESIQSNCDAILLLTTLDPPLLLKIFSSLLLERKVIFHSANLNLLSKTIQSVQALLYPLVWQHTFVPVLPAVLLEVCCSPAPFIVGVLSVHRLKLNNLPIDQQTLLVNLDECRTENEVGDETKILPRKIQRALTYAMKIAKAEIETCKTKAHNILVEAFLRAFVELIGHYKDHVSPSLVTGELVFNRDSFCEAHSSQSTAMFLQWFTETMLFSAFIDSRIASVCVSGPSNLGLFESRIAIYADEVNTGTDNFRSVKELGKKVRHLGGRLIGLKSTTSKV